MGKKYTQLQPLEIAQVITLYCLGHPTVEIARIFNIDRSWPGKLTRAWGFKFKRYVLDHYLVVSLYDDGVPVQEIADTFGITKAAVSTIARRKGCQLRQPKSRLRKLRLTSTPKIGKLSSDLRAQEAAE